MDITQLCFKTDRFVGVIRLDEQNTVKSLRDKLRDALLAGYADSGFPILYRDTSGLRVAGYIGMNELEHALGTLSVLTIPTNNKIKYT